MSHDILTEAEARRRIGDLIEAHHLEFTLNPGGGEFWHPTRGRLQIQNMDDREDYRKLVAWLAAPLVVSKSLHISAPDLHLEIDYYDPALTPAIEALVVQLRELR